MFDKERVVGFSAVARDITEKRFVDERIAESERRLLTIVNTVSEGISLSDEQGIFEVFNPRMEEITGYTLEEANESPDFIRLLAPTEDEYQRILVRQKHLYTIGKIQESEITIRAKSGEKKILLISSSLVNFNNRKLILSGYRDITEYRKAEEVIQSSAKRFRIFFENNPIPTWVFDLETNKFIEINNAALNHYGYSKDEFLAMKIMDLRPADDTDSLQEMLDVMKTRESNSAQGKHRLKDGTIIDVFVSWHKFDYDNCKAVLVVAQDITDSLRANGELRQAKRSGGNSE